MIDSGIERTLKGLGNCQIVLFMTLHGNTQYNTSIYNYIHCTSILSILNVTVSNPDTCSLPWFINPCHMLLILLQCC